MKKLLLIPLLLIPFLLTGYSSDNDQPVEYNNDYMPRTATPNTITSDEEKHVEETSKKHIQDTKKYTVSFKNEVSSCSGGDCQTYVWGTIDYKTDYYKKSYGCIKLFDAIIKRCFDNATGSPEYYWCDPITKEVCNKEYTIYEN